MNKPAPTCPTTKVVDETRSKDDYDDHCYYYVIVTAHPDDESMFFVPTIRSLTCTTKARDVDDGKQYVWLLCLTNGNYDGLGNQRSQELQKACQLLGISKLLLLDDDPQIQDHPTQKWKKDYVAKVIESKISQSILEHQAEHFTRDNKSTLPTNVDEHPCCCKVVLITFDEYGISGHVNHRDTYMGVFDCMIKKQILGTTTTSSTRIDIDGRSSSPKLLVTIDYVQGYTLCSEKNLFCKYFPINEWMLFLLHWCFGWNMISSRTRTTSTANNSAITTMPSQTWTTMTSSSDQKDVVTFRCYEPWFNWKAMAIHASQFVWYRRLFVIFSVYTYVNKLQPMLKGKR